MKQKSLSASLLFALLLAGVMSALIFPHAHGPAQVLAHSLWFLFLGVIGFLILKTGRISRWRAVFFAVLAWGFLLQFKAALLGLRGKLFFSPEVTEVPYCHIAIVSQIFNYGYQQLLAFQSGNWKWWGPLSLGFLWVVVTLAIGRGWCSWGCFYGGLDEGFSRVLKRPLLKKFQLPARLRDLPAAMLLVFALLSLGTMLPLFCLWVCPLKITTAFLDPNDAVRKVQLAVFAAVGVMAIVLLPLILKKRVFCGLICPFGAWQSFFGWIHPVRVTISPNLCSSCGLCVAACPTFVLTKENIEDHHVSGYCNHCGECMSACPTSAISYTLFGRQAQIQKGPSILRELAEVNVLYVFAGLLVGGVVGSLFVPAFLARFLSLFLR